MKVRAFKLWQLSMQGLKPPKENLRGLKEKIVFFRINCRTASTKFKKL